MVHSIWFNRILWIKSNRWQPQQRI